MKNDYGETLDRNGYAPSLVNWPGENCFICGKTNRPLQRHEVYHGPYRSKSKALGCWVPICDECHTKVHAGYNRLDYRLKLLFQKKATEKYGWSENQFREVFGKSYYEEEE